MQRPAVNRSAFTLTELLLAIGIVALLVMLMPLWLGSGQRKAVAPMCKNNLKNLALAVISYESSRNVYPGYRQDLDPGANSNNDDRSWVFVILPQLDNRGLYDTLRGGNVANAAIDERLELLRCPSVRPEQLGTAANCYVANTGAPDGTPDESRAADFDANGVFHDRSASAGKGAVTLGAAHITAGDGLSTTLLLSENADASRWTGGPLGSAPAGSTPGIAPSERWMGFTWHEADGRTGNAAMDVPQEPLGINVRAGHSFHTRPQSAAPGFARPSSFHPTGVVMAFCDGRVRLISEHISYGVYQALMTPRGAQAVSAATGEPLPADHAARQAVSEEQL